MKAVALTVFSIFGAVVGSFAAESCYLRFYTGPAGSGKMSYTEKEIENLKSIGFDDAISSLKINGPCRWIFYTESKFHGQSTILDPDSYSSLGENDDTFSSLRPLPPQGKVAAVLFEDEKFSGSMMVLTLSYNPLDKMEFNDKTSSIVITGGTWAFCQHAWKEFEGYTEELGPGDYPELSKQLQDSISLVKLVHK